MLRTERTANGVLIVSGDPTGEAPVLLRALTSEKPFPTVLDLQDPIAPDLATLQVLLSWKKTVSKAGHIPEIRAAGDRVRARLSQWGLIRG